MSKCKFRSRLLSLPVEYRRGIAEIPYQIGMRASSRYDKALKLTEQYGIEHLEIGTGTNRFIIKHDGFIIKIALDEEGIADNKQEWAIGQELYDFESTRGVPRTFEIVKGGQFLVAEYTPAFTSFSEMMSYRKRIVELLTLWNKKYLLGDVGLSKQNYANWGLRNNNEVVCLDYAYIFPARLELFKCYCGSTTLQISQDFTRYTCPKCKTVFEDRDIRNRISLEDRMKAFSSTPGIQLTEPEEYHEVEGYDNTPPSKYINTPGYPNAYETAVSALKMAGLYCE